MRIGTGYDVHRLVADRPLVLGGVHIPFEKGLLGHSDADVLIHSVCDALLGALGMGDIGQHFPDSSEEYRGVSSLTLLERCAGMMHDKEYRLANLDITLISQAPKISPYKDEMARLMAAALNTDADRINIKATTTEGLGFVGRGEGMAAECVALIKKR